MVAFSLSLKRPKTFTIPHFICLILVFMNTSACIQSEKMSAQQAKNVHLRFKETSVNRPPRALGDHIEYLVKMNSNNPSMTGECGLPEEEIDSDALAGLKKKFGRDAPWVLREEANRFFQTGNARHASVLADYMAESLSRSNCRAKAGALADSAKYHAAVGDYVQAEQSLKIAEGCKVYTVNTRLNKAQLRYELARAEAEIALAKGDMETASLKLYETLHHLETEGSITGTGHGNFNFRGAWRQADAMIALSEVMLWQGHRMEAEIWARKAASIPSELTLPRALLILGEIFLADGKIEASQRIAQTVLNMLNDHCVTRDAMVRAKTHQLLSKIYMSGYNWNEALHSFNQIRKNMETDAKTFDFLFDGTMEWGMALVMAGYPDESISQLDKAYKKTIQRIGNDDYLAYEIRAIRAMALVAKGLRKEALEELNIVLTPLLRNWRQAGNENNIFSGRYQRLRLIIEAYLTLLSEDPAGEEPFQESIKKGFEAAAVLHNFSVSASLAQSTARFSSNNPEVTKTIRAHQDLVQKLAFHLNLLAAYYGKPDEYRNQAIKLKLDDDIKQIKAALNTLDSDIRLQFPRYDKIVNPGPISLEAIRSLLNTDEALIVIFTGRERTFVWAISKKRPLALASVRISYNDLSRRVAKIRNSLDPEGVATIDDIPRFTIGMAAKLYDLLLKPIESGWRHAKNLIVVSDGPLEHLPLSVLPENSAPSSIREPLISYREIPWMIRNHTISVLPAVASLEVVRSLPMTTKKLKRFAGFGDPLFNSSSTEKKEALPSIVAAQSVTRRLKPRTRGLSSATLENLPRLPETAGEVIEIARVLNADLDTDVFLKGKASESQVKHTNLNDRKILLFATHGLVPGDLDGLYEPALALSNPSILGDIENDGILTMSEVMAIDLNADWVILSACNTAAGDGKGAKAISGLGQAFFYAGARALLVSMWPVETISAKKLTTGIFSIQNKEPTLSRANLLRKSTIDLIDNQYLIDEKTGAKITDYSHPMFWAPFILVGDGR